MTETKTRQVQWGCIGLVLAFCLMVCGVQADAAPRYKPYSSSSGSSTQTSSHQKSSRMHHKARRASTEAVDPVVMTHMTRTYHDMGVTVGYVSYCKGNWYNFKRTVDDAARRLGVSGEHKQKLNQIFLKAKDRGYNERAARDFSCTPEEQKKYHEIMENTRREITSTLKKYSL